MEEADVDAEDMEDYDDEYGEEEDEGEAVGSGKTAVINGMTATSHESNEFGVVTVTWCSPGEAGLADAFRKLAEYSSMLNMEEEEEGEEEDICEGGLPVREQTYDASMNSYIIDEMLSVKKESLSGDLFRVPAGFSKQKMPF